MAIKAVLTDIDNTIIDFDKSAFKAIEDCAKDFKLSLPDGHFEVFGKVNNELWGLLEQGKIQKKDIYKRRWTGIFKELSITADGMAFENAFRQKMQSTAIPIDGAEALLKYLHEKYTLCTASNSSKIQQEKRLKLLGFDKYFDFFFTSEEVGFQKPSRDFFEFCCKRLQPISSEETVIIGDSIKADIVGAKNFGIKSVWFNYYHQHSPEGSLADYEVHSLSEIQHIL